MFNFLFEGKIGDILAPVVPTNQLFLAIQHHRNAELHLLLDKYNHNSNSLNDGGYAAIHVACRYNNRFALELLLTRGTSILLLDQNGNSPLHYAAKYGHLDLCKYLVERGSMVNIKNKQLQTPYDISESHAVRQYLLPLQFQAERENPTDMCETTSFQSNSFPLRYHLSAEAPLPTTSYGPPSSSGVANTAIPLAPISYSVPPTNGISNKINTSSRVFQPDGFHSSASDPILQQKYGHIIEKPAIAPPPVVPVSVNYSNNSTSTTVFNRYIPYDPNTPTPLYPPPNSNVAAIYNTCPNPNNEFNGPPVYNSVANSPFVSPVTFVSPPTPASTNRLLGNKAILNPDGDDCIPNLVINGWKSDETKIPLSSPKKSSFGALDNDEIITANSSSSSIL